jgi:transcriptional regulator with XRE-family HTH domain
MPDEAKWSKDLYEKFREDPAFVAETLALNVALQINAALEAEEMSRKEFAQRLKVSQPYVTQMLGGQTNMTILTLAKISCALGLRLSLSLEKLPRSQAQLCDAAVEENASASRLGVMTSFSTAQDGWATRSQGKTYPLLSSTIQTGSQDMMIA